MRGEEGLGERQQFLESRRGGGEAEQVAALVLEDVEARGENSARAKGLQQGRRGNNRAAGGVDEEDGTVEGGEPGLVYEAGRLLRQRQMKAHNVRIRVQRLHRRHLLHVRRRRIIALVLVVGQHPTTEAGQAFRHS